MRKWLLFPLALLLSGPTPGDIGGCAEAPVELDAARFFARRAQVDCERCNECKLRSQACVNACLSLGVNQSFPEGCVPLVHDGHVCLRALGAASCDAYKRYVRDVAPEVPTECAFCPAR
jgi:hypothetical protein